jgi:hypothetical protein
MGVEGLLDKNCLYKLANFQTTTCQFVNLAAFGLHQLTELAALNKAIKLACTTS